jgi:hypothetical protein
MQTAKSYQLARAAVASLLVWYENTLFPIKKGWILRARVDRTKGVHVVEIACICTGCSTNNQPTKLAWTINA